MYKRQDLAHIVIPFSCRIARTALLHGLATWFDVDFLGSQRAVTLSTSPKAPPTHWYQLRLMLGQPLAVNAGQVVSGEVRMRVNARFSYDVDVFAQLDGVTLPNGSAIRSSNEGIDLSNPYYHYLSSPAAAHPTTSVSVSADYSFASPSKRPPAPGASRRFGAADRDVELGETDSSGTSSGSSRGDRDRDRDDAESDDGDS